jgi:[acyl-carrier-protein] S-malonyltransferase
LAESLPACRALFDRASEVLGYDLLHLCKDGPAEDLTRSDHAQPAIFVVSAACLTALYNETGGKPSIFCAGLSLGEWTALWSAGVLSFEDSVSVLQSRGRYMQEACEQQPGGMVSVIGLDEDAVLKVAEEAGLEVANYNSPGQIVLSGKKDLLPGAVEMAKAAGAKRAIPLKVAGAFHSSLMEPAAVKLRELLQDVTFSAAERPVMSNVTAAPHEDPEAMKQRMVEQVTSSVRWTESVRYMCAKGVERFIECGPGTVLTGLVKRIDKQVALHNIQDLAGARAVKQELEI